MRLKQPRIAPLERQQWTPEQREIMAPMLAGKGVGGQASNIFATLLHHPGLFKRWLVFGNHVLFKSTLPARDRELAILRIGWLCQSGYEFCQHVLIGRESGITDVEIERLKAGPAAPGWSERDQAILRATDELHADAFIGDATWAALAAIYSTEQIMDLVFAVGQYNLVSMALNTFGVQADASIAGMWPTPPG
ncbi:MAG: carboxymuconolactone decarboxylase family protein [Gammaproteobacteria bacterium]